MYTILNRFMILLAGLLAVSTAANGKDARPAPPAEMAQYFIGLIYKGD